jgi:putative CocE/NonD family hydrolase
MSLTSRIVGRLLKLPPAQTRDVVVRRDLRVPMRDGVTLLADHYAPRSASLPPTILVRCPYGRRGFFGAMLGRPFAERGFQVLIQSCRGTFGSGGEFEPFRREHDDGMDTVAWMREQPWFSGEFVTMGPSYLGLVQWAIAPYGVPELKAIAPDITASEFAHMQHPGGSFTLEDALGWSYMMVTQERQVSSLLGLLLRTRQRRLDRAYMHLPLREADAIAAGRTVAFYQSFLEHVPGDEWWAAADHSGHLADVTVPATLIGGWYDIFLPWQLRDYMALRVAGHEPHLLVGPWTHPAPAGMAAAARESLAWFRAHLDGERSLVREKPVRLFVMGAKEWRDFDDWPPRPARRELWHLQPSGGLNSAPPPESEPDHYRYDPTNPTPSVGGATLGPTAGATDNRVLEMRADVLVYTSAPLAQDLEVIGPVTAELYVRSSLEHTDFFARLCDVAPGGRSTNVCDGILRLEPGQPEADPDGVICAGIELWPTAYRFARGHRLRVQVSSGAHPRFARNTGSGEPLATATKLVTAEQAVYHDPAHPSHVALPVVE